LSVHFTTTCLSLWWFKGPSRDDKVQGETPTRPRQCAAKIRRHGISRSGSDQEGQAAKCHWARCPGRNGHAAKCHRAKCPDRNGEPHSLWSWPCMTIPLSPRNERW
jgi:hypothetical protein